jgi:hypothetical protein
MVMTKEEFEEALNDDNWEEIAFSDIRPGDKVKMERFDHTRIFIYVGTVMEFKEDHKWWQTDRDWVVDVHEKYATEEGWERIIYRRKPEPFVFPAGFGAMIEGVWNSIGGQSVAYKSRCGKNLFVKCQEDMWRNESGIGFSEQQIKRSFTDLRVVSKGIED